MQAGGGGVFQVPTNQIYGNFEGLMVDLVSLQETDNVEIDIVTPTLSHVKFCHTKVSIFLLLNKILGIDLHT